MVASKSKDPLHRAVFMQQPTYIHHLLFHESVINYKSSSRGNKSQETEEIIWTSVKDFISFHVSTF